MPRRGAIERDKISRRNRRQPSRRNHERRNQPSERPRLLDHAATTDVLPRRHRRHGRTDAQRRQPSSLHATGRDARATVEYARERIARAIGPTPPRLFSPQAAPKRDNLPSRASTGSAAKKTRSAPEFTSPPSSTTPWKKPEWLEKAEGAQLEWIPVDEHGNVNPQTVRELIERTPKTSLS